MAHIVTLKDNNDEISYPITPVDAVFVDNNTTLTDALDDKADADLSNVASGAITGAKIASSTVTASNLDWSSIVDVVGTSTGSGDLNYCIKYADGTMVGVIRKAFTNVTFSTWGSCYEHTFSSGWLGNWAVAFYEVPTVNISVTANGGVWVSSDSGGNPTTTKAPQVEIVRPSTISSISGNIHCIAIGRWKA